MRTLHPTRHRIHLPDDSRRWDRYVPRPDDIFISTPPKSGTTWTQGIVASLLWPNGDAPAPAFDMSPWFDMRLIPLDGLLDQLEATPHRRFVKTHSPADCIPIYTDCRYLAVYRDPRDAFVSWGNHRATMIPAAVERMNADAASDGVTPWPPVWNGDFELLFAEWVDWGTPMNHLASWWPHRREPFALLVHYADLVRDLEGEMRRIADFIGVDVSEDLWPDVVARCRFDAMRAGHATSTMSLGFIGGAETFFDKGPSRRWEDALSDSLVRRLDKLAAAQLPEDAAEWLAAGSLALGRRPADR